MRLFHFSEEDQIGAFVPRPVRTPSERGPGREWLNGPLVWAIEEARQAMYLFPRDCPRVLLWATPQTTAADHERWFGASGARTLAYVEYDWLDRVRTGRLFRYEFARGGFESLEDAGMWVSRRTERPIGRETIDDLIGALRAQGVELRVAETLAPLKGLWETSLHFSGIRLRHAKGWAA
ncbi:MAG: DUF6886 family protein [Phenylobacterium sp.]|uniref:DUF6886 family protein n=1 Tax=Phenylobacterium sp. TaxID=1871053 RepID=UPI0039197E02